VEEAFAVLESVGVSGLGGGFVNKESELWEEEGPKCFMACVVFALIWNIWFQYFKNSPSQANFCEICWLLYSILLQDLLKEYIWLIISRLELLLVCFFFFFNLFPILCSSPWRIPLPPF
jgi:hypothetical protein